MTGVPYQWGGTSGNGIDCSGFVRLLHRYIGIEIPRDADMQHAAAQPVELPYEPGDLFFFRDGEGGRNITHVGMSLGGYTTALWASVAGPDDVGGIDFAVAMIPAVRMAQLMWPAMPSSILRRAMMRNAAASFCLSSSWVSPVLMVSPFR